MTEPVLPVEDGVEVTLTCAGGRSNKGGKKATCQSGDLVPTKGALYCFGKNLEFKRLSVIVLNTT